MKLFQKSGQSISQDALSAAVEGRIGLKLRFRHDATTVILHPLEEMGVLDHRMAAVLERLKEVVPAVMFELFVGQEEDQDSCGRQRKKPVAVHPLHISIYGSDQYYHAVGSTLSDLGIFLQEPVNLDHGVLYRNPHFFSWDNDTTTPLLGRARIDPKADFALRIGAILDSTTDFILSPIDVKQDARISTMLRRYDSKQEFPHIIRSLIRASKSHQLSALQYMLTREDENQNILSLWKPHNVNNRIG